MSDAPKLLLDHHLKTLQLPTFLREWMGSAFHSIPRLFGPEIHQPNRWSSIKTSKLFDSGLL